MTTWRDLKLSDWLEDRHWVWKQICLVAIGWKKGDKEKANKMALAQYRKIYGEWPPSHFLFVEENSLEVVPEIRDAMYADLQEMYSKKVKK